MSTLTNVIELHAQRSAQLHELEKRIAAHDVFTDPQQVANDLALLPVLRGNVRKLASLAHTAHQARTIAESKGATQLTARR